MTGKTGINHLHIYTRNTKKRCYALHNLNTGAAFMKGVTSQFYFYYYFYFYWQNNLTHFANFCELAGSK